MEIINPPRLRGIPVGLSRRIKGRILIVCNLCLMEQRRRAKRRVLSSSLHEHNRKWGLGKNPQLATFCRVWHNIRQPTYIRKKEIDPLLGPAET